MSTPNAPRPKISDFYVDGTLSRSALLEAAQKTPNKRGILLWVGVAFAVMCAITGLGMLGASVVAALGYIVVGAGIAVACGWPLYCRRQDKQALAHWREEEATNRELAQYLTDEDRALLAGFDQGAPPALVPRKWKVVAPIAAALIVIGFGMTAAGLPDIETATTSDTYSPT